MRNHRVNALAALLVVLASLFAVACTDPSGRPASAPSTPRVDHDR